MKKITVIENGDIFVPIDPYSLNILLASEGLFQVEDKVIEFFSNNKIQNNAPLLHTDTVLKICEVHEVNTNT